uniref:Secreted protein n=1 Tax=Steinernema glaseri TaxID=37863 RepID=A0A1I7Y8X2_9BILA
MHTAATVVLNVVPLDLYCNARVYVKGYAKNVAMVTNKIVHILLPLLFILPFSALSYPTSKGSFEDGSPFASSSRVKRGLFGITDFAKNVGRCSRHWDPWALNFSARRLRSYGCFCGSGNDQGSPIDGMDK